VVVAEVLRARTVYSLSFRSGWRMSRQADTRSASRDSCGPCSLAWTAAWPPRRSLGRNRRCTSHQVVRMYTLWLA
jgi:hypothetical protein